MIVVFTISVRQWQNISPHLPPVSESTSCCLRKMTSLFEARKVAGSATYQQNETVLSGVVLLRSVCSFSPEKTKQVCLFSLFRHNTNESMKIFVPPPELRGFTFNCFWIPLLLLTHSEWHSWLNSIWFGKLLFSSFFSFFFSRLGLRPLKDFRHGSSLKRSH